MATEVELKLQDLAKIALGAPELTNANIAVLHSLIDILLKKLNCQNETVSLGANEYKHLEKISKSSHISTFTFNDENIEIIAHKLERVQNLEEQVNKLDTKLDKHLSEVQRQHNFKEAVFTWDNWESYGCEDPCTICETDNDMACNLLNNIDFLKKLLRRISSPMVDRMFYFEEKLQKLHEEFLKFINHAKEEYLKIQLLEKCILEIEALRGKINENQKQFLGSMEEIQDMLDAKLDKIHMPALKKYIRDHFERIDQTIRALQAQKQCPKAAGIIMDGMRCLSCGDTKVCSDVGVQPAALLPNVKAKEKSKKDIKYCGCSYEIDKIHGQYTARSLNLSDIIDVKPPTTLKDNKRDSPKYLKVGTEFVLMEGFDGKLYRQG